MPVPRPVTLILPHYLPHKASNKRKISEEVATKTSPLVLQHATVESHDEVHVHTASEFSEDNEDCYTQTASQVEVHSEAVKRIETTVVKLINCEKEEEKPEQRCKKHSRCHCDLLSLETTDFFTIKV